MLRLRRTLSNLDPLPAETKASVRRTIRFVPFFRKGAKIQVILLILSKKYFEFKKINRTLYFFSLPISPAR